MSPNWTPASAGVVFWFGWRGLEVQLAVTPASLFTREGGCPVWVPAFAGKQSCGVSERRF